MVQEPKNTKSAKKREVQRWRRATASVISASRKDGDLTQGDIAAKLGLSRETVGNMEAGRRKIEVGDLIMTARAVGIEPETLLKRILSWNP